MLRYAVIFFVIALIAAVLGFSGVAGAATNIAWILFVVFVILAIVSMLRGRRIERHHGQSRTGGPAARRAFLRLADAGRPRPPHGPRRRPARGYNAAWPRPCLPPSTHSSRWPGARSKPPSTARWHWTPRRAIDRKST